MSDTSQGPDWWMASDGKWYPPELYPKDWTTESDQPAATTPDQVEDGVNEATDAVDDAVDGSVSEVVDGVTDSPAGEFVEGTLDESVPDSVDAVAPTEDAAAAVDDGASEAEPTSDPDATAAIAVSEMPETETAEPQSVPEPPPAIPVAPAPPPASPVAPAPPPIPAPVPPSAPIGYEATQAVPVVDATQAQGTVPSGWSGEAPAAPVPGSTPPPVAEPKSGGSALGAAVAAVGGVGMVVGSLLEWAAPTEDEGADVPGQLSDLGLAANDTLEIPSIGALSGDSNSVGLLIAGIVAVAAAVLLFRSVSNIGLKLGLIAAGLAGAGLGVFSFLDLNDLAVTVNGQELAGISFDIGIGLWVAIAGGAVAAVGGLLTLAD